ncbi:AAA family ATPase, partial [bacterium]|nr:AAA family ATPase [bacterium]
MKKLISEFIAENYLKNKLKGYLIGSVISIDIKGFTSMTEKLMRHGKIGAEVLSDIINLIFDDAIKIIYEYGGFGTTFAGDAFTAIFPNTSLAKAKVAGEKIQKIIFRNRLIINKYGKFELNVRIGLSFGRVYWQIIKGPIQNSYIFKGKTIMEAAKAQEECKLGSINIYNRSKKIKITGKKRISDSFSIDQKIFRKVLKKFIPDSVLELKTKGEFRYIVSFFISFDEKDGDIEYIGNTLASLALFYKGFLNKIDYGDKGRIALVLFGAPLALETPEKYALNFALKLKTIFPKIKIGITSGKVFSGFIGNNQFCEYSSLGKTVNLSARISLSMKKGTIGVSPAIFKEAEKYFVFNATGKFSFKGFNKNIFVHSLMAKKNINEYSFQGKLIGREKEIEELMKAIKKIRLNDFGGIIYVNGVAGVGKTRLVETLKEKIDSGDFNWFFMPCDKIIKESFNPIKYFLRNYFLQREDNSYSQNKRNFNKKFQSVVSSAKNNNLKTELIRTKSILSMIVNINFPDSLYDELDAKGRYENTILSIVNLLKIEALNKPTILEIDDGQWIDSDSEEILRVIAKTMNKYPILIFTECRPTKQGKPFKFKINIKPDISIFLKHLNKNSGKELIKSRFGENVDPKLEEIIINRCEGNPFYIEQMVLFLKESNSVTLKKDKIELINENMDIPSSISSIVVERIDKLNTKLKTLVKTASILGKEFSVKVLSGMLKQKSVDKKLKKGEEEAIWSAISELWYVFKHTMIRDAVYEMQLKKTLMELHRLAGETMEKIYKNNLSPHYGNLAYHFENSKIIPKAKYYLKKAALSSKEDFKNTQALKYLNKLLNYEKQPEKIIDMEIIKAEIYELISEWFKSEACIKNALKIANKANTPLMIAKSLRYLSHISWNIGNFKVSIEAGEKAYKIYKKFGDIKGMRLAIQDQGYAHFLTSSQTKVKKIFDEELELARKEKDILAEAIALDDLGALFVNTGENEKAVEYQLKYLRISEKLNKKIHIKIAYMSLINSYYSVGDYKTSIIYANKLQKIATEHGDRFRISFAQMSLANNYYALQKYPEAFTYINKCMKLAKDILSGAETKHVHGEIYEYIVLAKIQMKLGLTKPATGNYFKAEKIANLLKDSRGTAIISGLLGIYYRQIGQYDISKKYLIKGIKRSKEMGLEQYEGAFQFELTQVYYFM